MIAGGAAAVSYGYLGKDVALLGADQVNSANGLLLNPDLQIKSAISGAQVYFQEHLAFEVNKEGARLLRLANGEFSLAQIIDKSGYDEVDTATFFVTLSEAGYMRQLIEVNIVETRI